MLINRFSLLIIISTLSFSIAAQDGNYRIFRSFTVADGLPSNHIYTCVEDNKGFLWVATDAGIARFDGKYFQLFTTKDGLPDDEVLDVVKEKNGRIWVNCFNQYPAYFDETRNRFINAKEDSNLARVKGTSIQDITALQDGGVMYRNEKGSYFYEKGIFTHLFYRSDNYAAGAAIRKFNSNTYIAYGHEGKGLNPAFVFIKDGQLYEKLALTPGFHKKIQNFLVQDNKLYITNYFSGAYYIYSDFQTDPLRFRIDSGSIGEPVFWRRFTEQYFIVIGVSGTMHVFDKQTLKFQFQVKGNYSPNSLSTDRKGNIWVSTKDKGLILYKKRAIETFITPEGFNNTNFLSIARKPGGNLLAGNFYNQVVETDGKMFVVHTLPGINPKNWQRKIIVSQDKIFTFGEGGCFISFSTPLMIDNIIFQSIKTASVLNDSNIIVGYIGGLTLLNSITGKVKRLPSFLKRTTTIAATAAGLVYHGSTDGLYKFDLNNNRDDSLSKKEPLFGERIVALCTTADNYIWVATASKGLLAVRNDSIIKIFTAADGIISNNLKCVAPGRPGEVWLGTNNGISVIRYKNNLKEYTYQNLTINDGLSSNIINEMLYSNDTMFCATGNGICAIPAVIQYPPFDITVELTGIRINNRDTSISNKYNLNYSQNNIELHFAGIELGGHFNFLQYNINNGAWQTLDANSLSLQLNSGNYTLAVRAVDVNGNAGSRPLLLTFNINTPFWKSPWFWVFLLLGALGMLFIILRKREQVKQEAALQSMLNQKKLTELELQALKSQINPHFIFNCLNSIKLLNHQQKYAEAEKYLDRFAALLRSALEQSSLQYITLQQEIDFIGNYLALEKLRLPDKLTYTITIDSSINIREWRIPSMMLQPHIENAVKHGLAPLKNKQGLLQVRFSSLDQCLLAEVEDNGVGIKNISETRNETGIGTKNTDRRGTLYNIITTVTDLKKPESDISGTLIQLKIPNSKTEPSL